MLTKELKIFRFTIIKGFDMSFEPHTLKKCLLHYLGAQMLNGRVLDSRPRDRGLEPHRRHCHMVCKQDTFILA